jgi:hypothetical protein
MTTLNVVFALQIIFNEEVLVLQNDQEGLRMDEELYMQDLCQESAQVIKFFLFDI